jgi:glycosyltransferase involved in cell wall biosynthesis
MPVRWHILTGEYPPASGGVGDYTAQLAAALTSAGDAVTIWTPGSTLPDRFGGRSRAALDAAFRAHPGVVLLQYVPNALGARGMNLRFCLWLRDRARGGADVRVMFHEPYFYFTLARPWQNVLAAIERVMARVLLDASKRAYVSTDTWRRYLTPRNGTALELLPIPSNIQPAAASHADRYRGAIAPDGGPIVGHFGTYGDHVGAELLRVLPQTAERCATARFAFIGSGSVEFVSRLGGRHPRIAARSWASGRVEAGDVSSALRACDVLIQPYPDGITTRRTSAMAGLQHGVPTVTTSGALTEAIWAASDAVALAPADDAVAFAKAVAGLLRDRTAAQALGRRGASTYERHFSLERTLAVLRAAPAAAP